MAIVASCQLSVGEKQHLRYLSRRQVSWVSFPQQWEGSPQRWGPRNLGGRGPRGLCRLSRSQPAGPGSRPAGKARAQPARRVWLDGVADGDRILVSLNTFLAAQVHFTMAPCSERV